MTIKTRRVLFMFFLMLFVVITPLLSLYASGYKLSGGLTLTRSGAIILNSEPKGAKIIIDGKLQKKFWKNLTDPEEAAIKTPAKIKGLLPGKYDVRLELENYWAWEKQLEVKEAESTFAEDISLFMNILPYRVIEGDFDSLTISPNSNRLALTGPEQVALYDLRADETEIYELADTDDDPASLSSYKTAWSKDSRYVLAAGRMFDVLDWQKPLLLSELFTRSARNFQWHKDKSLLFFSVADSVIRYDPADKSVQTVYKGVSFSDFLARNGNIILTENNDSDTELIIWNIDEAKTDRIIKLPRSEYVFLDPESSVLNLLDTRFRSLYLVDLDSPIKPIRDIISNTDNASWIGQGLMLYANEFEIFLYVGDRQEKILLTRISQPIHNMMWHPNSNYVFYATGQGISSIELDSRDRRNITKLTQFEIIMNPAMDKNGNAVYFLSRIGKQSGVFKLNFR